MKNIKKLISGMLLSVMILSSFPGKPVKAERNINVIRIAGADRFETAEKIADKVIELGGNANEYALANGLNFPDALSGGAYCAKFKLPLLLSDGKSVPEKFRNKPAIVFGGEGVVNPDGINLKKRLAGKDRFETSKAIAMDGFGDFNNITIASGFNFYDALSAVPLCVQNQTPLLLYNDINNTPNQPAIQFYNRSYERAQKAKPSYVNGYFANVIGIIKPPIKESPYMHIRDIKSPCKFTDDNEKINRMDRYLTNLRVANVISKNEYTRNVIIANGLDYADALAGSTLSSVLGNAPIVLTEPDNLSVDIRKYLLSPKIENVYILGGTNAISKNIEEQIKRETAELTVEEIHQMMPKWSVCVKDDISLIIDVVANSQLDFSNVQEMIDNIARWHIKAWVNEGALFNKTKTHGDGKSIIIGTHSADWAFQIHDTPYIYFSDSNGVVKKYVKSQELTKTVDPNKALVDKDEWSLRKGTYGDCVGISTCTRKFQNDNVEYPIYKIHIFKLAE